MDDATGKLVFSLPSFVSAQHSCTQMHPVAQFFFSACEISKVTVKNLKVKGVLHSRANCAVINTDKAPG